MVFEVNNYVLFKCREEWQEGRVVEVLHGVDGRQECYRVLSLRTYSDGPLVTCDDIVWPTCENVRRTRCVPLYESCDSVHVPAEVMRIIREGVSRALSGEVPRVPAKTPVSAAITGFKGFIQRNKRGLLSEEVEEVVCGLSHCFNSTVRNVLFCHEVEVVGQDDAGEPVDVFGVEYFLRVIFFVEKRVLSSVRDHETRRIIFEYFTYVLDYLNMNKGYFE